MFKLMQKISAVIVLLFAGGVGYVSFLLFLYFLYAGSLDWVRLNLGESGKLLVNGVLSFVFFIQHSGMIRRSFRKNLSRFIPAHFQGAAYTVASGVVLLVFVALWQGTDTILVEANEPFRNVLRLLFLLSILGMLWGMWALRSIDMFGLGPILTYIRTTPRKETPFTIRGPYRWVRHPLYLFMLVLFWSCPVLTTDRLLCNVLWTIWVVAATILEERDLIDDFGDAYRDYQAKVPMLLPRGVRPAYPAGKADNAS